MHIYKKGDRTPSFLKSYVSQFIIDMLGETLAVESAEPPLLAHQRPVTGRKVPATMMDVMGEE